MIRLLRLLLLVAMLQVAATSIFAQTSWVDGGRKQSQDIKGNGGLLVYEGDMYFWNEENHFQISTDNGATWSDPLDSIGGASPHVRRMTAAGGRIYAGLNFGTGNGIPIYSTDKGVSWMPDTLGAPGHALGWDGMPAVSGIYAWGHWVWITWDQPVPYSIQTFDGPWVPNDYMNIGTNNPSSVIAKGDTLFAAGSKIYYTTDGGATFTTPANNGYSGYGGKLFVDGSRLYMFAYKAWGKPCYLYYSDDNAENWTEVDITSLTNRKIVNGDSYFPSAYFIKGNRIEFATDVESFNTPPNVWKSTDLGATWERDTVGLPSAFIPSVVNFAYTSDGNLWCVRDHENIYKQKIDDGTGSTSVTTAPLLLNPQDGKALGLNERLVWSTVPNATSYQLQIATDGGFASIVVDQSNITDTSALVASLAGTNYYWRVRGIGAGEKGGPWSNTGNFHVVTSDVAEHADQQLSIGPNPCHDRFTLRFPEGKYTSFELRDLLGRVMKSEQELRGPVPLAVDVSGLAPGIYWLVLKGTSSQAHSSAIVVK